MKDILTIVFRLTLSCMLAGTVMGTTFVFTNKAKKHNEHVKEEKVAYSLLGFDKEVPESAALSTIYRYVVSEAGKQSIGYLLPSNTKAEDAYTFIRIDLDGNLVSQAEMSLAADKAREVKDRDIAILAAIGPGKEIVNADKTQIVSDNGARAAYLISGKFPGFKTHIAVMIALAPDFTIIGFEVLEHEEDPGLGGEIEQEYFKNQFKDKPYDVFKGIDVVKAPIPADYIEALEVKISGEDLEKVMAKYRGNDIYALTGATISTVAVTDGMKGMVKKFAYRINILDSVLKEQNIAVSF
jgi:electron transport complex protein RnfG